MFAYLASPPPLNLAHLPPTYVLPAHLSREKLAEIQDQLRTCKCPLIDVSTEASLFLADTNTKKRCELELRRKDIVPVSLSAAGTIDGAVVRKVRVVKLEWFTKSLEKKEVENIDDYVLLETTVAVRKYRTAALDVVPVQSSVTPTEKKRREIMDRAKADAVETPPPKYLRSNRQGGRHPRTEEQNGIDAILNHTKVPPLLRQSTSSFEETGPAHSKLPDWVRTKNNYSCCRATPLQCPNNHFVSQLKIIKLSRVIGSDRTGARAYSTAIAAVKAYPFVIKTAVEVQKLPGCNGKIAGLFYEWKNSDDDPEKRTIGAVRELEGSQAYQILKRFHSIWGIGPDTATKMYYKHDYRSLEDIIYHHWDKLSRAQQIGVKYYDELLTPIPMREQDRIKGLIDKHAVRILPGVQSILVGGYRRGKAECMDVDLLLSHPRDGAIGTDFLMDLLRSLEKAELITHTLSVSSPKLHHGDAHRPSRSNFDTLDKALLIWQTKKAHLHRRVDIIIAPTVSAGTALLGWTGATTFERDLRLWCENEKRWKFTSQGVWIGNERVEDTYGWRDGETWVDVEKRIFKKLGIEWREPTERCTE